MRKLVLGLAALLFTVFTVFTVSAPAAAAPGDPLPGCVATTVTGSPVRTVTIQNNCTQTRRVQIIKHTDAADPCVSVPARTVRTVVLTPPAYVVSFVQC